MPRHIDYKTQEIIFYKFCCNDNEIQSCYVGHTISMYDRKRRHKSACNNPEGKEYNLKIYQTIRANGGWNNWRMIEIEKRLCRDVFDCLKIEQQWIDKLAKDMNMNRAFITEEQRKERQKKYEQENKEYFDLKHQEYYEEHKKEILDYHKNYYINNKEKLKQQGKDYYLNNKEHMDKYYEQWREEHKDEKKEYDRLYRLKNIEKIKERKKENFNCDCGTTCKLIVKARHCKTIKHQTYLETLNNNNITL